MLGELRLSLGVSQQESNSWRLMGSDPVCKLKRARMLINYLIHIIIYSVLEGMFPLGVLNIFHPVLVVLQCAHFTAQLLFNSSQHICNIVSSFLPHLSSHLKTASPGNPSTRLKTRVFGVCGCQWDRWMDYCWYYGWLNWTSFAALVLIPFLFFWCESTRTHTQRPTKTSERTETFAHRPMI